MGIIRAENYPKKQKPLPAGGVFVMAEEDKIKNEQILQKSLPLRRNN